jgi:putative MATE family efflux protein
MLKKFFADRIYYRALLRLGVPIIVQHLITASMNIIDVAMIGQLGETSVAAVGLSNQAFFILTLMMFGISSGSAIFTAQFWGKRDVVNIRRVLGICLTMGIAGSLVFTIIAVFFSDSFLGFYSKDLAVIAVGSRYLRIVGLGYIVTSITFSYASILRSTEEVRLPMMVSAGAIIFKTVLSYLLIFGHWGFPEMGVEGAAIGTVIARYLECGILVTLAYRRKTAAAARLSELNGFKSGYLRKYIKTAFPVAFNELAWALGITTYNVVYARISTEAIAAMNIVFSIENLAFVAFIGISEATGILIGNRIGAGEEDKAFLYARRSLILGIIGSLLIGIAILLNVDAILSIYKVSETARMYSQQVLIVSASILWLRVSNLLIIVGILRAGGDTRFGMLIDMGSIWAVGVPMAFFSAFVLHLPVHLVFLMVMSEEVVKFYIGLRRFISRRWINNLANVATPIPLEINVLEG